MWLKSGALMWRIDWDRGANMHHMDTVAKQKAGGIEGWEPWFYERITGGLIIKGGVPRLITRGSRKGKKTWDKGSSQTVLVSFDDIDRERQRYEAETGRCGECYGEARVVIAAGSCGTKYKPCPECNGTGLAPNVQATGGSV